MMKNSFNYTLFWDTDKNSLDISKHKRFIIERVLRFGMLSDIQWLLSTYHENEIINVVQKSKSIDKKTANFWTIYYGIDKDEVLCLNRPLMHELFY
jgi:hypothetical protein